MPLRLTLVSVATPLAFVTTVPTATPSSVNATDFPLTGNPDAVSVADTWLVPPYTPFAAATDNAVAAAAAGVIVVGSLAPLLAGVVSPPPLTVTWFVTLGGAELATLTVIVSAG
jgi:hypothetical protein